MKYITISPIRMGVRAEACGKINGEEKDCSLEVDYGKYHFVLHMEGNQIELPLLTVLAVFDRAHEVLAEEIDRLEVIFKTMETIKTSNYDSKKKHHITYCSCESRPFDECEKHWKNLLGRSPDEKVWIANIGAVCRRYVGWLIAKVDESSKIPNVCDFECKLGDDKIK